MKHYSVLAGVFSLVLLLSFSGCSQKPEARILGKWKGEAQTVEFSKDKTMVVVIEGHKIPGIWAMPNDHTLNVILHPPGADEINASAEFKIKGDTFTYDVKNMDQSAPHEMQRVKE